jgi:hypothetical protein
MACPSGHVAAPTLEESRPALELNIWLVAARFSIPALASANIPFPPR